MGKEHLPLFLQVRILQIASLVAKNPDWPAYLGIVYDRLGNYEKAISAFQKALRLSDRLVNTPTRTKRQAYQFWLERARYNLGQPYAKDPPLIFCNFKPLKTEESLLQGKRKYGNFELSFIYSGLQIKLQLGKKITGIEFIDLFINNIPFRRLKVQNHIKELIFIVKRPALAYFPRQGELSVRASNGSFLLLKGRNSEKVVLEIPHGTNNITNLLKEFVYLEKKGSIPIGNEEIKKRHEEYLKLYAKAKEYFDKEVGRPLFLMYGTLLGVFRDGDFIPGDDDFDVGYISDKTDPVAVKEEAKAIIEKLLLAGFTVTFNQSGRPFRLRDSKNSPEVHLDVRPLWNQNNKIWAHLQACLPLKLEDFEPVRKTDFRDIEVYIPHKPEVFLGAYYGVGWKTPDPSYCNKNKRVDPLVKKNLTKACLTIGEFRRMKEKIYRECNDKSLMGELIFQADMDLYPLDEYEAKCGWD
jgi:tetratricopeptide (TPR) repeat protein